MIETPTLDRPHLQFNGITRHEPVVSLRFLGTPQVECFGRPAGLRGRKPLALLAYLALGDGPVSREALAALLWPEFAHARGLANLRRTLATISTTLGSEILIREGSAIELSAEPSVFVDARAFVAAEQFALPGGTCSHHGAGISNGNGTGNSTATGYGRQRSFHALSDAVELYRGDFLAGFTLQNARPFDDWQVIQTERLRLTLLKLLRPLVIACVDQADYDGAIAHTERWLEIDPLNERAHRYMMRLYAWIGHPSLALDHYQELVCRLAAEDDQSPRHRTTDLRDQIKRDRELPLPDADIGSGDRNEYRNGSVNSHTSFLHVLQQTDGRCQHLGKATVDGYRESLGPVARQQPGVFQNGHVSDAQLTGLAADRQVLGLRLVDGDRRLITLTGLGGIGKTHQARRVARDVGPAFTAGVEIVDVGALEQPVRLLRHVADRLSKRIEGLARGDPEQPVPDGRLLVILDGCEHALADVARQVPPTLEKCPRLTILATSLEPLYVDAEQVWPVRPLELPTNPPEAPAIALATSPAMRLFEARATLADPHFRLTKANADDAAELCRRLGGIPLAIEIAASYVGALSISQIIERLSAHPDRLKSRAREPRPGQESLAAAIERSHRQLSDNEAIAFHHLSALDGGWSLAAAEAACIGDDSAVHEVAGLVASLVDKSLVVPTDVGDKRRYGMLPPVRQYGQALLTEAGEAVKDRAEADSSLA